MNSSEPADYVDKYIVSPKTSQEQNLQNKIFVPANIIVKSQQQLQYNFKSQSMPSQLPFQSHKRPIEDIKSNETNGESINVGTQKTAEKMRKDEGNNIF